MMLSERIETKKSNTATILNLTEVLQIYRQQFNYIAYKKSITW